MGVAIDLTYKNLIANFLLEQKNKCQVKYVTRCKIFNQKLLVSGFFWAEKQSNFEK